MSVSVGVAAAAATRKSKASMLIVDQLFLSATPPPTTAYIATSLMCCRVVAGRGDSILFCVNQRDWKQKQHGRQLYNHCNRLHTTPSRGSDKWVATPSWLLSVDTVSYQIQGVPVAYPYYLFSLLGIRPKEIVDGSEISLLAPKWWVW